MLPSTVSWALTAKLSCLSRWPHCHGDCAHSISVGIWVTASYKSYSSCMEGIRYLLSPWQRQPSWEDTIGRPIGQPSSIGVSSTFKKPLKWGATACGESIHCPRNKVLFQLYNSVLTCSGWEGDSCFHGKWHGTADRGVFATEAASFRQQHVSPSSSEEG